VILAFHGGHVIYIVCCFLLLERGDGCARRLRMNVSWCMGMNVLWEKWDVS
jgi:hypothetical protein